MTAHSDSPKVIDLPPSKRPVQQATRTVLVNDYVTNAQIGVYSHEKERRQKIRLSLRVEIDDINVAHSDQFEDVLCYKSLIDQIEEILEAGHINLVETLAEKILDVLALDPRSKSGWVRVEKLEAIAAATSVGIEIQRHWLS